MKKLIDVHFSDYNYEDEVSDLKEAFNAKLPIPDGLPEIIASFELDEEPDEALGKAFGSIGCASFCDTSFESPHFEEEFIRKMRELGYNCINDDEA